MINIVLNQTIQHKAEIELAIVNDFFQERIILFLQQGNYFFVNGFELSQAFFPAMFFGINFPPVQFFKSGHIILVIFFQSF